MNRPTGVTVAAVLTFFGAMILALGSCAFFVVGVMAATGDEGVGPVRGAITGSARGGAAALVCFAWSRLRAVLRAVALLSQHAQAQAVELQVDDRSGVER